ncbi:hypothetical protein KIPB_014026, partial [Kipferlia bialata]|eukprot:g14026.t1
MDVKTLLKTTPTEGSKTTHLRACIRCRLLKDKQQFLDFGCENCPEAGLRGQASKVITGTTTAWEGMTAIFRPEATAGQKGSWLA